MIITKKYFSTKEKNNKKINDEKNVLELKNYIEKNLDKEYYSFLISGFIFNLTYARNLNEGKEIIDGYIKEVVSKEEKK